ncbi:ester hydrolase C11orf54 homolog isoform X2 [Cephus cinctus]|uniref:Ester hydrolase C11orf54 homolog isoform X2 n=2 Tax=Cephus cinctus TaxID=211228 RepID=A0AAJ7C0P7_CEPCN|nr:ester hydrolase C11orf54 homolog isoform X2 [Cephus cinctus]
MELLSSKKVTIMSALDSESLEVVEKPLFVPPLEEIRDVLKQALPNNFAEVAVEVVDCPDLTKQPFTLAAPGLGGKQKLIEIGGPPYLLPLVQREKIYDVQSLLKRLNYGDIALLIGAGAGPWPYLNCNCELVMNLAIAPSGLKNETRIGSVNKQANCCVQQTLPEKETRLALLANIYVSEGKPGKVLKVHVKKRIGQDDFIASIRKAVRSYYKDKLVGLGGTFLLKEGKAKQHVMSDFSTEPLNSDEALNDWLYFFDMSAPLIAVGTMVTDEAGMDLRVQHFHSFSHHGEAGHYHIDTTPDVAEYLGYFNVGEALYRVDQPPFVQNFGKD